MGHAARVAEAKRIEQASRPIYWLPCDICRVEFPSQAKPDARMESVQVCQRCYMADLARIMRECPERFRLLPSVRALQGLPQVNLVTNPPIVLAEPDPV